MYKYCTTEGSSQRQRQLEQHLLQLMQVHSYSHITISQICDLANISRKSFYRYFSDKDSCLTALVDHCIYDGASSFLPAGSEPFHILDFYTQFFTYWQQQCVLLDVLRRNNLELLLPERMIHYAQTEEQGFQQYLGKENDSFEQILFMVSGVMGLILNWHRSGFEKSPFQMAQVLEKVIQN